MLTDFLVMLALRGGGFRWGLVGFGIGLHAIDASNWHAILGGWMAVMSGHCFACHECALGCEAFCFS